MSGAANANNGNTTGAANATIGNANSEKFYQYNTKDYKSKKRKLKQIVSQLQKFNRQFSPDSTFAQTAGYWEKTIGKMRINELKKLKTQLEKYPDKIDPGLLKESKLLQKIKNLEKHGEF